jgi:outer membrane protein W
MNRTTTTIPTLTLTLALALAAGAAAPAAADDSWQLKVSGISAQSTAGGGPNSSLGGGLAVEYRATPRLGIELGGLTTAFEDETSIDFFQASFISEVDFRMTPLLARLNVHLTPDRRVDLYVGPVAGYVLMSDLTHRLTFPGLELGTISVEVDIPTEDQFTWGAHVGLDVRLGQGSSFLSAGATYLDLPLEIEAVSIPEDPVDTISTDFDPLVVHLGYSYRF